MSISICVRGLKVIFFNIIWKDSCVRLITNSSIIAKWLYMIFLGGSINSTKNNCQKSGRNSVNSINRVKRERGFMVK